MLGGVWTGVTTGAGVEAGAVVTGAGGAVVTGSDRGVAAGAGVTGPASWTAVVVTGGTAATVVVDGTAVELRVVDRSLNGTETAGVVAAFDDVAGVLLLLPQAPRASTLAESSATTPSVRKFMMEVPDSSRVSGRPMP